MDHDLIGLRVAGQIAGRRTLAGASAGNERGTSVPGLRMTILCAIAALGMEPSLVSVMVSFRPTLPVDVRGVELHLVAGRNSDGLRLRRRVEHTRGQTKTPTAKATATAMGCRKEGMVKREGWDGRPFPVFVLRPTDRCIPPIVRGRSFPDAHGEWLLTNKRLFACNPTRFPVCLRRVCLGLVDGGSHRRTLFACPLHAQDDAEAKRQGQVTRRPRPGGEGDWTHDSPRAPNTGSISTNCPRPTPRLLRHEWSQARATDPENAELHVPAGFKIEEYATGPAKPPLPAHRPQRRHLRGRDRGE